MKRKKSAKESRGKIGQLLFVEITLPEKASYSVGSWSSKKPYSTKLGIVNKASPDEAPMYASLVPKCTKTKEGRQTPFAPRIPSVRIHLHRERTRELFEKLLEHNIIALPKIKAPKKWEGLRTRNTIHTID